MQETRGQAVKAALETMPQPERYPFAILMALQQKRPYQTGTVPPSTVQRRRAANKVARASRRRNRA